MCPEAGGQFYLSPGPGGWTVGRFRALEALGVPHAVTTRSGPDVSAVRFRQDEVNLQLAAAMDLQAAAWCHQVHGPVVLTVDSPGLAGEADGLVTAKESLGVWGRSADCPLILAADAGGAAVGMAHASWRGTVHRIAERLVDAMGKLGSPAGRIVACICPSAGPCCYEVGQDVLAAAVGGIGPDAGRFFRPVQGADGKYMLDLWSANVDQLLRAGLAAQNIHVAGVCTMCRNDVFPSHRREGDKAGRFAAIIGKRPS